MTHGEAFFYLREINGHWRTTNVSPDKLQELEAARLIDRRRDPIEVVRLTAEGARWKAAGRSRHRNARVQFEEAPKRSFHRKKKVPAPKPWS